MIEIQKELFDEFGERDKKKRSPFRQSEMKQISFSSSFDTLLLSLLLLIMGVVIVYAVGVEIGRQERLRIAKRGSMKTIVPQVIVQPVKVQPPLPSEKVSLPLKKEAVRKYTVQVTSFTKKEDAERTLGKLRGGKEGTGAFLISGPNHIALCIGTYETRGDADRALNELQKRYKDSFVRNR